MNNVLLKTDNIHKSFGITKALRGVGITVYPGEVHGLIGENGSGKSTLASIVAGSQKPDSGEMVWLDKEYRPDNVFDAIDMHVCMIGQEQCTFDEITVAANIFVGKEKRFMSAGLVSAKKMNQAAQKVLDQLGLSYIKSNLILGKLNFEERKLVELARAMYSEPVLLIIDETSTALSKYGRDIMYKVIDEMKRQERAVLFISHDIDEIMDKCDRVTILRDGAFVATLEKSEYEPDRMRQLMVGRKIDDNFYRSDYDARLTDECALEAKNVSYGLLNDCSISLHYGEILGIGGLTDSGMHELGRLMFGLNTPEKGRVVSGSGKQIKNPTAATASRIAYISKNRDKEALMTASTIQENICLPSLQKLRSAGLISNKKEAAFTEKWASTLSIKYSDMKQNVSSLSGGNKQKVAVAKWLGFDADVFIFDCPTRGIDVGVKADIYKLLMELRKNKKAILMISEELPEIIGMSDRIIIMKKGGVSGEFYRSREISEHSLIEYII